jgi:photosystem II stability/assembly factor-like uncharacterized protein
MAGGPPGASGRLELDTDRESEPAIERDPFEREQGESESIQRRIFDYLERHGDRGRIDPERRLRRVAAEYERHSAEAGAARRGPLGTLGALPEWVSLGPTNGAGRMTAIAPVPGAPGTAYAGAAGGGVWKTTDGGGSWVPLTDGLHDLAVGALAVAPSNPSRIYVGTGEGGYGQSFIPGIGLVKSDDGGATWILPDSVVATAFYRILVHPARPDEIVAGTNAGAFRSTDGGATWTNVISRTAYGEVADMVRDPRDPAVLYASTWCAAGGCDFLSARVLRSTDGGATWSDRSAGLPSTGRGRTERTSLAISPSDPGVLYAARGVRDLVVTGETFSHIYKTTDSGASWKDLTSLAASPTAAHYLGSQSYYDNSIVVSPNDSNVVIAGGVTYVRSTDAGATFANQFSNSLHVDVHDLRYEGSTLWIANDGGIWTSEDDGKTATPHNAGLVTRQFYSVANDPSNRDRIIAGSQDNGTVQRLTSGTVWRGVEGGDGLQCVIHPLSSEIAWVSIQGGLIERTHGAGSADAPRFEIVTPPYEADETVPFVTVVRLDPREPGALYSASSRVWRSRDGGDTWRPLPTATADGSSWDETATIRAIALPSDDSPVVMVAKGNGVFRSANRGETWVSGSGLPGGLVTHVEIDPGDPSTAFACIATTTGPPLYRTADGGLTWTPSASGLPLFAAQVVRFSPTDANEMFCGTDVGVFRSTDRGASWTRAGAGLPASSVHDVRIFDDGSLVRVATYGRGIWELRLPQAGSTPPSAVVLSPGGPVSVAAGASIEFAGAVGDADAGDSAAGTWFFPDDSTTAVFAASGAAVKHTFRRGGVFPVALSARDSRGAGSSATVVVSVAETSDACAAPAVIPGAGPFPYTLAWDDEAGTNEPSDPSSPCLTGRGRAGSTWFEFTPSASGTYRLSTCTEVNTAISVFTGAACGPYTPVPYTCNPIGEAGSTCGVGTTSVTVSAQAGQTLRLQLGGVVAANVGPVRLTVAADVTPAFAPRVSAVSQRYGPPGGGTEVVILGSRFRAGAAVFFGSEPATEVSFLASTVLTARTPPHAPGPVEVSVSVPFYGKGTLGNAFLYETIESADRVSPSPPPRPRPPRIVAPH